MNKKRTPLYDTKTYTLENKDIPLGIAFAIICLGLATYTIQQDSVYLSAATSLLVYLSVLLSSNRTRILTPVVLSLLLLIPLPGNSSLIRVVIFSALIGLTARKRESVSPLILLLGLWVTYLNFAKIAALLDKNFYTISAFDIKLALAEITGFLILLMLLWCRQFPALFGRLPREVEIATVSFVLFLLSSLVGAAVAFTGALHLMGISFDSLIANSSKESTIISGLTITLLAIPLTLSLSLNKLIRDFAKRIEQILSPNSILGPVQLYPKIVEFNQIFSKTRELLDDQERKTREYELNVKNTLAQKEEKEKEYRQRVNDSENLATIFSVCPTGVMAVSASGAVLSITPALISQFGLKDLEKYIGRYYLELQVDEDASSETRRKSAVFLQFIARLINDQKNLVKNQALRSFIQIDQNNYAEMTVYAFEDRIVPVDWKRISPQIPPSDLTFVIFSNVREDHRKFIINQLYPRTLELIGGQSLESLLELTELSNLFDTKLENTIEELNQPHTNHLSEIESQLRTLIKANTDFNLELKAIISDQLRRGVSPLELSSAEDKKQLTSNLNNYNLTQELQSLLHLFEDLYGLDAEVGFSAPEALDSAGVSIKQEVKILAVPSQFNEFKSMLTALLCGLAQRIENNALSLTVGTEQIGMTTATLFKGSTPGRYARIVISHPGQSITPNMMPDSLQKLAQNYSINHDLATALGVLSLKIQRMKGFLSIQSSPAKGTHLTIYLPEDPQNLLSDQNAIRKIPQSRASDTNIQVPSINNKSEKTESLEAAKILVIEDNEKIQTELFGLLKNTPNLHLELISRVEAKNQLNDTVSSGAGFDASPEIDQLFSDGDLVDFESYNLVIISIIEDLTEGMKLLKKLSSLTNIAVVTTESDYADALSAAYNVLSYPLNKDEILARLNQQI